MKRVYTIFIISLLIVILVLTSFVFYAVIKMNKNVEGETKSYYYQTHDLTNRSLERIFNLNRKKYIVYFFSPTCSSCLSTSDLLNNFIRLGYDELIEVFFVDISYRDDLVSDNENYATDVENFFVAYTPTLLVFDSGTIGKYVGEEQIILILDKYAKNY